MNAPRRRRLAWLALLVISAIGVAAIVAFTSPPRRFEAIEGRPLLQSDGERFADSQVGLQFTPPPDWAMQARSTMAPEHRSQRLLVKYKRVTPNVPSAWLRVRLSDVPEDRTPAQVLSQRKPPEANWIITQPLEDGLTIGGLPAARVTFGGQFDHDGKGDQPFATEFVAVRRGPQIYEFAGTYMQSDLAAKDQFRAALDTVVFAP